MLVTRMDEGERETTAWDITSRDGSFAIGLHAHHVYSLEVVGDSGQVFLYDDRDEARRVVRVKVSDSPVELRLEGRLGCG